MIAKFFPLVDIIVSCLPLKMLCTLVVSPGYTPTHPLGSMAIDDESQHLNSIFVT
jgi:hypothetical protein